MALIWSCLGLFLLGQSLNVQAASNKAPGVDFGLDHSFPVFGLAYTDFLALAGNEQHVVIAAATQPGFRNGGQTNDPRWPAFPEGNARRFTGKETINYASRAEWIGRTLSYAVDVQTSINWNAGPDSPFFTNTELVIPGEILYSVTGDSPVLRDQPDGYLIPKDDVKFLPEAVQFCRVNAAQLQATSSNQAMLTRLLSSDNPFLRLMAIRAVSHADAAMPTAAPNRAVVASVLKAAGETQAAGTAIVINAGGADALALQAEIIKRVKTSTRPDQYADFLLGCYVAEVPPSIDAPTTDTVDFDTIYHAMTARRPQAAPHTVLQQVVVSILSGMGYLG